MNKNIEELAKDSCLYHYMGHLYSVYAPDGYRVPMENRMKSVEKFAELIVKECANIAWNNEPEGVISALIKLDPRLHE